MSLDQLPPAWAQVPCSGTTHTLLWRDGRLDAPDHADPEAERALTALGGEPCRCVQLLDAWESCSSDARALILGPRGPELLPRRQENRRRVRVSPARASGSGPASPTVSISVSGSQSADETPADPLLELLLLGGAIPRRLVATAGAALDGRLDDPELGPRLHAAIYGRLLAALRVWLGELPALELTLIDPDAAPSLVRDGDLLRARLPFAWLVDVWAAELETVAGRLTLSARWDPPAGRRLVSVDRMLKVNTCNLSSQ